MQLLLGTGFLYRIHGTRPAGKPLPTGGPLRERQPAAEGGAVGRHHATMPPCHHATMPPCHHATMPPCHHADGQWAHTACSRIRIRLTEGGAYPVTPRDLRSISG
jgi:hypothetical protein